MIQRSPNVTVELRLDPLPALLVNGWTVGVPEVGSDGWEILARLPSRGGPGAFARGRDAGAMWEDLLNDIGTWIGPYGEHVERIAVMRAEIEARAGDEWMEFPIDATISPSGTLRVPSAPFRRWSLRDMNRHLWPEWSNVCPLGMRLRNDDPNHSDWLVGAGLDPWIHDVFSAKKGSPSDHVTRAAYEAMWELQHELLGFRCAVLCGAGKATGKAWHPQRHPGEPMPPGTVAILPDAGVRWLDVVSRSATMGAACIVETGGSVAHLVNVGRGMEARIVRVPDARRIYLDPWTEVTVDCDWGTANITPP